MVAMLTNPGNCLGLGHTVYVFSDVEKAEAWFAEQVGLPFKLFDEIRTRYYHDNETAEDMARWDGAGLDDPWEYFDVDLTEIQVL